MRKALLVGIVEYSELDSLPGVNSDIYSIRSTLATHYDRSPNFACRIAGNNGCITTRELRYEVRGLLDQAQGHAIFYFAGHGIIHNGTVALMSTDGTAASELFTLIELLDLISSSTCPEVTVFLDCCFSGSFGEPSKGSTRTLPIREGTSVLTATRTHQRAVESPEGGVFTRLVVDALMGSAADLLGNVNIAGVYNYTDSMLSPWSQRPMLKANISTLSPLRKCEPRIDRILLGKLRTYFPNQEYLFPISPVFNPMAMKRDSHKVSIFKDLVVFEREGLVRCLKGGSVFSATINSGYLSLTLLGKYYLSLLLSSKL